MMALADYGGIDGVKDGGGVVDGKTTQCECVCGVSSEYLK